MTVAHEGTRGVPAVARFDWAALIGFALAAFGVLMMVGWLLAERAILDFLPGYRMVFNTALCFALAGAALACGGLRPALRARVQSALGSLIAAAGAIVLSQHLLERDLGIDWRALHAWNVDGNPYPGRMAPATTVGFLLSGAGFLAMHQVRAAAGAWIVHTLAALLAAIGLLAIAGDALSLRHVFPAYAFAWIALPTAAGFVLVAAGQALTWPRLAWHRPASSRGEDRHIAATSAAIVFAVAVCAAIAGFATMQRGAERQLHRSLEATFADHEAVIRSELAQARETVRLVATRPSILRLLHRISADPGSAAPREELQAVAQSFLPFGYSTLVFRDREGNALASAGAHTAEPALRVALVPQGTGHLAWHEGFLLEASYEATDGGERLGSVWARRPLPGMTAVLREQSGIGPSEETGLCAAAGEQMRCFPSRLRPEPGDRTRDYRGQPLPMAHALAGERGVLRSLDDRGVEVVAAYGPAADTGLAMVVKVDGADLYALIRDRLPWFALALAIAAGAGILALRARVAPLASRLARREEQLRFALEGSGFALWEWQASSGKIFLGAEWREMLGGEPRESVMTLDGLSALLHPEDRDAAFATLRSTLKGEIPRYDVEHRVLDLSGKWLWIRSRGEVVERDAAGRALRMVGTNAAISERKEREQRFAHQATHDALTGLPNRALFEDRLERALARAQRSGSLMALLYMDIDRFKSINDTLGHAAGDALLRQFAERLSACVRGSDTVARLGGDEFTAILENLASRDDGHHIAEKIVAAMRPEFPLGERTLAVTTSVGMAFCAGEAGASAQALSKLADEALYAAKAAGRDGWKAAA